MRKNSWNYGIGVIAATLSSLPAVAFAQINIPGWKGTFGQLMSNLINYLVLLMMFVAVILFLIGAFYLTLSHGKEDQVKKGRDLMKHSLMGLGVVVGSYAIVRTFLSVVYGTP